MAWYDYKNYKQCHKKFVYVKRHRRKLYITHGFDWWNCTTEQNMLRADHHINILVIQVLRFGYRHFSWN